MGIGERKAAEILSFPALKTIPPPQFPLKGKGYDKYVEVATTLLRAGKLNTHTMALCEQIGLAHGEIYRDIERRGTTSAKNRDAYERLCKELRFIDNSEAASPEEEPAENRFARFGIVTRRGASKAAIRSS